MKTGSFGNSTQRSSSRSSGRRRSALPRALALGFAAALVFGTACGPELSRISQFDSLRLVGLKKSAPYAAPGESVELSLLWEDASTRGPRNVERFIGFWCVNPPGSLFSECLNQVTSRPQVAFNEDRLTIRIPEDALRTSPADPQLPPNGVAYVFYAVCAGRFSFAGAPIDIGFGGAGGAIATTDGEDRGTELPTCIGEDGEPASANDYVIGYSAINIYEEFRNENPIITGFEVAGREVTVDCIGEDCVGAPFEVPELDGCVDGVACIEACEDDGAESCPEIEVRPLIPRSSAEADAIAKAAYDDDFEEGLWVSYFADRGSFSADVRLVNDATTGWNERYESKFYAPKEKGPLRLWATVRDNRGGIEWVRLPAYVR